MTQLYCFVSGCVQTKPLLIRVDTKSGHGAGKPTMKTVSVVSIFYQSCKVVISGIINIMPCTVY